MAKQKIKVTDEYDEEQKRLLDEVEPIMGPTPEENDGTLTPPDSKEVLPEKSAGKIEVKSSDAEATAIPLKTETKDDSKPLADGELVEPLPVVSAPALEASDSGADTAVTSEAASKETAVVSKDNTSDTKNVKLDDPIVDEEDTAGIDDVLTDQAVEAIVAKEGDDLLKAQDEKNQLQHAPVKQKRSLKASLLSFWHHKKLRNSLIALLVLGVLAAVALPKSRYAVLNTAGVRVSASFKILDEGTEKPIRNADVSVDSISARTDDKGEVKLTGLRLGPAKLTISKRSFSTVEQQVVVGLGSNPFTPIKLVPTGTQYNFVFTDWLSGQPVQGVELRSGDSGALSTKEGIAALKLDPGDVATVPVNITAKGYRTEELKIPAGKKETTTVKLVAGSPHYFMSRRNGNYDLYKIDADGKNEVLILAGTGKERDDISLSPSPDRKRVALVSTRKGKVNKDGYALQNLVIIDPDTKEPAEISEAEEVRLIGWVDSRIVFLKVSAGASGATPNRQKLMSYDIYSKDLEDLASSDSFYDVKVAGGKIYFAPGNVYGDDPTAAFYVINADGSGKKAILNKQVWSILRNGYSSFTLSTNGNKWYDYTIGDSSAKETATPTATPRDRRYSDNPSHTQSVWLDYRDGKGVILVWDTTLKGEKILLAKGGVNAPLQWLSDNHLVYRLSTSTEVADYVINISGGTAQKIADVAATQTER